MQKGLWRTSVSVLAIMGCFQGAVAQDGDEQSIQDTIIVQGVRAALTSAADAKRNAAQVVDVVNADDIGALPDDNVAEALQRVPGVQIGRSRGEGDEVTIRGIGQVLTLVNGRETFTGIGRSVNFQDVPADAVSGIAVYKSPMASQIEGGIGGIIDLKRRNTTELDGLLLAARFDGEYADLIDDFSPKASGVVGNSYNTASGTLGFLAGVSYQERNFRADQQRNFVFNRSIPASPNPDARRSRGSNVVYANGVNERFSAYGAVDWESDATHIYLDALFTSFDNEEQRTALTLSAPASAGAILDATFDDPGLDLTTVLYDNPNIQSLAQISGRNTDTFDIGAGVEHVFGKLTARAEISYTDSSTDATFRNMRIQLVEAGDTLAIDYSGVRENPPVLAPSADVAQLTGWRINQFRDQIIVDGSDAIAARLDFNYNIGDGFFQGIEFGGRYFDRDADRDVQDLLIRSANLGDPTALDGLLSLTQFDDFGDHGFASISVPQVYTTANTQFLLDEDDLVRSTYGFASTDTAGVGTNSFTIGEQTIAGYLQVNYDAINLGAPVSGNVGVRIVNVETSADGQRDAVGGGLEPISVSQSYTEVLPSLNLRYDISDNTVARVSAARVMGRPNFFNLTPSQNLNFGQGTGSEGNPGLSAFTATQVDVAVERYFGNGAFVYATGFYKRVDGFLQRVGRDVVIDGVEFNILRPVNGDKGTLKGVEVGGQYFFDNLPAPFDGFGLQANYTFIDSNVPSALDDTMLPLIGLSDHSYNVVGVYEKGPLNARVAWNWRSEFHSVIANNRAIFQEAFGQLDASIAYNVTDQIKLTASAKNLTRNLEHTFYEIIERPRDFIVGDRRFIVGIRAKL